jgi:hypothetical protein
MNEFSEPWMIAPRVISEMDSPPRIIDADGTNVCDVTSHGHEEVDSWTTADRIVSCVNFLAGIPDSTLESQSTVILLIRGVLRGDADATYALADLLMEKVGGNKAKPESWKSLSSSQAAYLPPKPIGLGGVE